MKSLNKFMTLLLMYCSDLPRATSLKLLDILQNTLTLRKLKMELALVVDGMTPFVPATYSTGWKGMAFSYIYSALPQCQCNGTT